MKILKHGTIIFGDFNIKTLEHDKEKTDYCDILGDYDSDIKTSLHTRVTPTSRSCIDQFISQKSLESETIRTTISDHYSVLFQFYGKPAGLTRVFKMIRFLHPIKIGKSPNFLFLSHQKLKGLDFDVNIDEQAACISKTLMDCVDNFASEKPMKCHSKSNKLITNKIKDAIHKRD